MSVLCRRLVAAVLLAASFSVSRPAPAAPDAPSQFDLTILHDNDLHGHLLPFAYIEKGVGPGEIPSVGGAARRATLIRRLRKQIENPTVLVDSGDTFTRGPLATTYEGIADTEAMNAIGYDLAAGDGFFEVFRHKEVTRYDVFAVCPFHDDVVTATLTGAEIQDLLKGWPKSLVSGDPTHADPVRTYRVAFVDYEAESEYKLPAGKVRDTGLDLRQVMIDYLKTAGR